MDALKYRHFRTDPHLLATSCASVVGVHIAAAYKTAVGECGFSGDTKGGEDHAAVQLPIKWDSGRGVPQVFEASAVC